MGSCMNSELTLTIDGLPQERRDYIANALELRPSHNNPSIYWFTAPSISKVLQTIIHLRRDNGFMHEH